MFNWYDVPGVADPLFLSDEQAALIGGALTDPPPGDDDGSTLDALMAHWAETPTSDFAAALSALMASGYIGKPTVAPTDGQYLKWDAATSRFVPVNPIGNSEVASASNTTANPTALSAAGGAGAIVAIPSTGISVTAAASAGRPITLEGKACFAQSAAGVGTLYLLIYETTGGGSVLKEYGATPLPNTAVAGLNAIDVRVKTRLGVVASTRTFELRAYIFAAAANNPAGSINNQADRSSLLTAVAG